MDDDLQDAARYDAPVSGVEQLAPPQPRSRAWWIPAGVLATAAVLLATSWWMTGAAPKPVDERVTKEPPPIALPGELREDRALSRAARALESGDTDVARAGFTDIVANDPDSEPGQVGLVLSGWKSVGSASVENDLEQLRREYPDSAYVATHLALVQSLRGQTRAARTTLRGARASGWEAGDDVSLGMATIADELLHPRAFRGYVPVLIAPNDVPAADRPGLRRMLDAVATGDRPEAAEEAGELARAASPMTRAAAAAGAFEKDRPEATVAALAKIADAPSVPRPAADRANLLRALALAWDGEHVKEACTGLRALADAARGTDAATKRLAAPIATELCA